MKALKEYLVEDWKQGVYELITQRGLWTNENEQTICFYSKLDNVNDFSSLDTFRQGCSLILLSRKLDRQGLPTDGYTWTLLTPKQPSNKAFDAIIKAFDGKLVETISGESSLQFAQRGPVVFEPTKKSWQIDIYTFNPKDIDMKKLQRASNQNPAYITPKFAPTGMAGFDKKYYYDPFHKYIK